MPNATHEHVKDGRVSNSADRQPDGDRNLSKLTPEAVKRLTEKISEMMGQDITQGFEQVKNERGEFLNEEGLPIIDITEPLATATTTGTGTALLTEDDSLPALSALPLPVKERLRQQRDSILDQLEEEERLEQKREEQVDLEERQEILRKRKEAAAREKEKLKVAKEMQKKMGRALLSNMAKESAPEEALVVAEVVSENVHHSPQDGKSTKKTVAFADLSGRHDLEELSDTQQTSQDWGDITPARLRATNGPSLLSSSEKLPMKMTVVERTPNAPPRDTMVNAPDSDDESDSGLPDADEEPGDNADNVSESDLEIPFEEDELDLDFAQHQREIALEYHEKRSKIGAAALAAMTSHSHDGDGGVRVDIPLDMPSSPPEKPPISRFKATHLASSYNVATSPSTSLGASVVPASTARTLQKAIRTGKLDADTRLVGGDADSGSENENEGMQELLELLAKGEVYNLGPDGKFIHAIPPSADKRQPASVPTPSSSAIGKTPFNDLPPIDRPKTSKFKLSRAKAGRPSDASLKKTSGTGTTLVSVVERPSPKPAPAMAPTVLEKSSLNHSSTRTPPVVERSSLKHPTVVERRPATTANPTSSASTFPSMIVNSPSFPAPASAQTASPIGTVLAFPTIVDSPSFAKPEVPAAPRANSRASRPPTVMSSAVRESSRPSPVNPAPSNSQAKAGKLSRFMEERYDY